MKPSPIPTWRDRRAARRILRRVDTFGLAPGYTDHDIAAIRRYLRWLTR